MVDWLNLAPRLVDAGAKLPNREVRAHINGIVRGQAPDVVISVLSGFECLVRARLAFVPSAVRVPAAVLASAKTLLALAPPFRASAEP